MNNIKTKVLLLLLLLYTFVCCSQNNHFKNLCGDSIKYWEPHYSFTDTIMGVGMEFSKDSIFRDYIYKHDRRIPAKNRNNLLSWGTFKYHTTGDTLIILSVVKYKFIILFLNNDSLILNDISDIRWTYHDTILYLNKNDTTAIIYEPPFKVIAVPRIYSQDLKEKKKEKKNKKRLNSIFNFLFTKRE